MDISSTDRLTPVTRHTVTVDGVTAGDHLEVRP